MIVLDEPTRGVDVGAKRDIYFLIHRLAAQGRAVIVISSELMELIGLCHRVAVMRAGALQRRSTHDNLTEEELIAHATGTHCTSHRSATPRRLRPRFAQAELPVHGIGPLIGLVAAVHRRHAARTATSPPLDNAMNVLTRTAFIGIIAVGMTFVIISGGIDLSVGSMAALIAGSMIC